MLDSREILSLSVNSKTEFQSVHTPDTPYFRDGKIYHLCFISRPVFTSASNYFRIKFELTNSLKKRKPYVKSARLRRINRRIKSPKKSNIFLLLFDHRRNTYLVFDKRIIKIFDLNYFHLVEKSEYGKT